MSHKAARTHTHVSNRAKARQDGDRKVVFKSVLENPIRIQWPSVPVNLQNQFLAVLVRQADGVSEYRQGRNLECLKRKRARKDPQPEGVSASKKTKIVGSGVPNEAAEARNTGTSVVTSGRAESLDRPIGDATAMEAEGLAAENEAPPSILQHLTIGINEVTRKLESQIKASRQTVVVSDKGSISSESSSQLRIKVVFVCRADVDPPILIDHLPHLVSMCNSSPKLSDFVKLVPLPKGAEFTLASALGLRRVAVLAFDSAMPELSHLLQSVPTLTAPWLHNASMKRTEDLQPTHIKQVRTSAPKDMKAAKEQRAKGRAAAKQRTPGVNEPNSVKRTVGHKVVPPAPRT